MGYRAILKVGGREFDVLKFDYSFQRETELNGMPSSAIRGGKINIEIEKTSSTFFFEWICNSFEKKDGSIVTYKTDEDSKLMEIRFKNAYLVAYNERFSVYENEINRELLTLSALEIIIGNSSLQNGWS